MTTISDTQSLDGLENKTFLYHLLGQLQVQASCKDELWSTDIIFQVWWSLSESIRMAVDTKLKYSTSNSTETVAKMYSLPKVVWYTAGHSSIPIKKQFGGIHFINKVVYQ